MSQILEIRHRIEAGGRMGGPCGAVKCGNAVLPCALAQLLEMSDSTSYKQVLVLVLDPWCGCVMLALLVATCFGAQVTRRPHSPHPSTLPLAVPIHSRRLRVN